MNFSSTMILVLFKTIGFAVSVYYFIRRMDIINKNPSLGW